jgi:hypothetical protein
MLAKDYRGKNAEPEIREFEAALGPQILNTLKQAAIAQELAQYQSDALNLVKLAYPYLSRRGNALR